MLVLGRRKRQSVVIGDEITLTVEEISDIGDGQKIIGATVRLGFQMPRDINVCRSELLARRGGGGHGGGAPPPRPQPRSGDLVALSDAQVRLRIEVPRKVPVRHNGAPTKGLDSEGAGDGEACGSQAVHYITCQKDDRVAICNNIMIAALEFHRFVADERDGLSPGT